MEKNINDYKKSRKKITALITETEGTWEMVVDFTALKKGGVNIKELLSWM